MMQREKNSISNIKLNSFWVVMTRFVSFIIKSKTFISTWGLLATNGSIQSRISRLDLSASDLDLGMTLQIPFWIKQLVSPQYSGRIWNVDQLKYFSRDRHNNAFRKCSLISKTDLKYKLYDNGGYSGSMSFLYQIKNIDTEIDFSLNSNKKKQRKSSMTLQLILAGKAWIPSIHWTLLNHLHEKNSFIVFSLTLRGM